jgi:hypothetical protein
MNTPQGVPLNCDKQCMKKIGGKRERKTTAEEASLGVCVCVCKSPYKGNPCMLLILEGWCSFGILLFQLLVCNLCLKRTLTFDFVDFAAFS